MHHNGRQVIEEFSSGGGSGVDSVLTHVQLLKRVPDHGVQFGAREGSEVEAL